jgi:integration host factor subunit beta
MTRSELVARLAQAHPHLTEREMRVVVATFFREVAAALRRGDRVELRGFGSFWARRLGARDGHHPGTGRRVGLPEKRFPAFRPSRLLGDRLGPPEWARPQVDRIPRLLPERRRAPR